MMFAFGNDQRRRARPSIPGLGFSMLITAGVFYLSAVKFFLYLAYIPILIALGVSLAVFWFRARALKSRMPEPYGRGRASKMNTQTAIRWGMLASLGGGFSLVGLMASVFFLPPAIFLGLFFGVTGGLPLSQLFFFTFVAWYEKKSGTEIFYVNGEATIDDQKVLVKAVEMS